MAKKVTIAVLSLLIVAGAVVGVVLYNNDDVNTSPTESTQQVSETIDDVTVAPTDADISVSEDVTESENVVDDSSNTADITTTDFTIEKVLDHTTGEQVPPRVVFGSGFSMSDNYIKFSSDGSFEMYLSGYFSKTTKGSYVAHDDYIYVEFDDGQCYEYDIEYDDNGIISYIIVGYGDYSIYFS